MESVTRQFCFEEIPEELRQQNNWVDWRFERRMKDGARRNPL
jgi:primase-polymerase (primpol)-like protein